MKKRRVLDQEDKDRSLDLYWNTNMNPAQIARRFGVSDGIIHQIIKNNPRPEGAVPPRPTSRGYL